MHIYQNQQEQDFYNKIHANSKKNVSATSIFGQANTSQQRNQENGPDSKNTSKTFIDDQK